MIGSWCIGLVRRERGRLLGTAVGIAVAVALLASLGSFMSSAKATMTKQATTGIGVDWQVEVAPGANATDVLTKVRAEPGTVRAAEVGYATSPGLSATTIAPGAASATAQSTSVARVLGVPHGYATLFPGQVRLLSGSLNLPSNGAPVGLLAQQTASNLAARVGDTVRVARPGSAPLDVTVGGIVDLPHLDSMFQKVGAPPSAQASAPPDNVVILSHDQWAASYQGAHASAAENVTTQIHVARDRNLSHDPAAAYAIVLSQAHHLESKLAGAGQVGNNLAASLDSARSDALYAQVLFVFLALPGAALAIALTFVVTASGEPRRRRARSLLRLRGAQTGHIMRLAAVEGTLIGVVGSLIGCLAALVIGKFVFGAATFGSTVGSWWTAIAGIVIALIVILVPAYRDLRRSNVLSAGQQVSEVARSTKVALPLRLGLDIVLTVGGIVVYLITSRAGYNLVLAPEGVPSISVDYWAFVGPAMLWVGLGLLAWRIIDLLLRRGRRAITTMVRPMSGTLAGFATTSAVRRRGTLARAGVLAGLALAFATSTAAFNATYHAQAEVDARLTNGSDVAVTVPPGTTLPADTGQKLAKVSGVATVEPLMHRYAFIGSDLQDLYGVQPGSIASATKLQDAYFTGGTASQLMAKLARHPDSILVSQETVKDYQLHLGDQITLRLQDAHSQQTVPVKFHYIGVAKEFPTAPKDSFFVTNSSYVAQQTNDAAVATYLINTSGNPHTVAGKVRAALGSSGPAVTDITTTRTAVGSSLTAVDLNGLTRVELGFGLLLAVACGGLVLGLGLTERRRDFSILSVLGATSKQVRAFIHVDTVIVTVSALVIGGAVGAALTQTLVKMLNGVFDPPPEGLTAPWLYLSAIAGLLVVGVVVASGMLAKRAARRPVDALREM
ncbi:putative ABC transport system permease protein [Antricoccus suffuscus]|uniref:Putative ABC transport system permease protein n=1 Tax=Antricoccus suffuscus TaxID=1629062 RepID=A0A2T1A5X4_9ACTN|nr:ABC transporter permease [Antricoccus suffuscus]PRZ43990.1 putative ABC transport system permease protein [Antricoccus suffuscus]